MKYQLNITKEQRKYFGYFTLGLLILLEALFYKSGFSRVLFISLKLSLLVHLAGYLITLRVFKEEFDTIALLFLGLSFGLILAAFWYYIPTSFGVNINSITYAVPLVLVAVGFGINISEKQPKPAEEKAEDNKSIEE